MPSDVAAKKGGLLRVLLLWLGTLSPDPASTLVLQSLKSDWAGDARVLSNWGMPAAILLVGPLIGTRYLVLLWPMLLAFMGVPAR